MKSHRQKPTDRRMDAAIKVKLPRPWYQDLKFLAACDYETISMQVRRAIRLYLDTRRIHK
jgi:hypothetical protein